MPALLSRGLRALFVFSCVLVCCLGNDYPQAQTPNQQMPGNLVEVMLLKRKVTEYRR